jgi:PAS domain S-box-containing protein
MKGRQKMTVHLPLEVRLHNAQSALRKTEERHRLALLAGGLGSWEMALTTMTLASSEGCKVNYGLSSNDDLTYDRLVGMILPEDRPAMQAAIKRAVETGEGYQAEYRIRRPDGLVTWIAAHGQAFFAPDGTPEVMLGTTQDITDRKHAEAEHQRALEQAHTAREEAEGSVRLRNTFLTLTVHDLRAPLTAIRLRAQLLQRRLAKMSLAAENRQPLEGDLLQIQASTAQMESALAELQDVALLQVGRPLDLKLAPANLVDLVRSSIDQVTLQTDRHHIDFHTARDHVIATVDANRIDRVIDNLLSNAIKYSPQGGKVTVTLSSEPKWVVLSVRDEGVGIPADEHELIFQHYRRGTNVTDSFEGTGIGLAGSRQIVEQHSGSLCVNSQEGCGSTFTVLLPVQEGEVPRGDSGPRPDGVTNTS